MRQHHSGSCLLSVSLVYSVAQPSITYMMFVREQSDDGEVIDARSASRHSSLSLSYRMLRPLAPPLASPRLDLCTHVDKCRPSRRRHPLRSERSCCVVERIRHRVGIDSRVCKESLVEPGRQNRAIVVIHRPAGCQSAGIALCAEHLPHGCDHALVARKEHGGSEVHDLVRVLCVAFCRLARAEIRKERILQVQLHELRDGQIARTQAEAASVRLFAVLDTVTSEVDDVGRLKHGQHLLLTGRICAYAAGSAHTCCYIHHGTSLWHSVL